MSSPAAQTNVFQQCIQLATNQSGDSNLLNYTSEYNVIECVSSSIQQRIQASAKDSGKFTRDVYLVFAAAMVFFMNAGFAMLCAGCVRKKNVQNTMVKNLLDTCGAALAFYSFGYAFAYGGTFDRFNPQKTFMGTGSFFLYGVTDYSFWLFQFGFSAASTTIVAGALAERCQMTAYLCYSLLLSGWVYPIVAHSVWCPQGFLSAYNIEPLWNTGVIDFAGSGVVHITGGLTALFATMILGPRRGRFHDDEGVELDTPRTFPGSSVALQMLGTFILWFGWYGFNSGNALLYEYSKERVQNAAIAAVNTTLSASAAGLTALLVNFYWLDRTTGEGYFDLPHARNGALSGLVASTSGCALLKPWAGMITGILAGLGYLVTSRLIVHFRIDDAVDAVPVHLTSGIIGLLMTGLLANPDQLMSVYGRNTHVGLFYSWSEGNSDFVLLGTQIVGMLFIAGWVMFMMVPFFIFLDFLGWFRSDPLEEIVGLDTSYHGGIALIHQSNDPDHVSDEHTSEFHRKRQEAKNIRLRILQKLNDNDDDKFPDTIDDKPLDQFNEESDDETGDEQYIRQ